MYAIYLLGFALHVLSMYILNNVKTSKLRLASCKVFFVESRRLLLLFDFLLALRHTTSSHCRDCNIISRTVALCAL